MEIAIQEIRELSAKVLRQRGLEPDEIEMVLDHLLDAELSGKPSHGFIRVIRICKIIDADPMGELRIVKETPVSVLLDGGNRPGIVVATRATEIAIEKARAHHVGLAGGYNCDAIYVTGAYARQAALEGLIGIVTCNSTAAVAPWGSIDPIMGTNPLAIAVPTGDEPIVLDFATSKTTYGDVMVAMKTGLPLPHGILIDKDGQSTTDPNAITEGALLPIAAHKGSGLSMMLEILAGPLVNAKGGREAVPGSWGFFVMVFDPEVFGPLDVFQSKLARMVEEIKGARRAPGCSDVLLPGEKGAQARAANAARTTLLIPDPVIAEIQALRQ